MEFIWRYGRQLMKREKDKIQEIKVLYEPLVLYYGVYFGVTAATGSSSKSGERQAATGKLVTIYLPDEPAIEEWWVSKSMPYRRNIWREIEL